MFFKISDIAKVLQVRPKRVMEKVCTLDLEVQYENESMCINTFELRTLLEKYKHSKRTSERTKELGQRLLVFLEQGGTDIQQLLPISSKKEKVPKKALVHTMKKENMRINSNGTEWIRLPAFFKMVQNILAACVQGLESLYFKFFALFVAIFVQMHHTAVWFFRSAPEASSSWLAAYGYAIMLDLFILVVTLEGRLSIAKTFAGLTFISNLLYFQFWVNFDHTIYSYTKAVSCSLISATIAFILYSYTEIFVKYRKEKIQIHSTPFK